ncbi:MAG: hypothetical protein Q7S31_02275, partial [bacterium]|nr:hypothetical protein [bacterium]
MHYNPASAKAIRMRIDSETALIVSQPRYISEGLFNRNLVGGIADLFHQGIRNNVTFGALPHYGAKILAAYATEAGFKPELVSLYDPQVVNMAKSSGVTLVSAMDIGLDQARNVFTHLGPSNKILAGGYGISADAQLLHREFPWLTIIPGEAEGVLAHALSDLLNHGQMEPEYRRTSPFNLAQSASEPHLNPHIESKLHNLFGWTPVKVTEVSRGCPEACDFCPTAMLPTSVKPLDVLDTEVQNMHLKPWEPLVFLDQNLMVCPSDYLEALFDYLNQRHILWAGEGTITYLLNSPHLNEAAKHRLLRKMGKNCLAFLVGVEDLNGKTRGSAMKNDIAKSTHLEDMAKLLREYRIPIVYSLIFASDSQEVGYARHAADVVNTLGLTAAA